MPQSPPISKKSAPGAPAFYLMLHASTEAAEKGLICGAMDVPLSEEGMKEAKKAAKAFSRAKPGVSLICCSPLLRSIQMADFVHDEISAKLRVWSELSERKLGDWEGKRAASIPGFSPLAEKVPGGEDLGAFRARATQALEKIGQQPAPILVVGHGIFGQVLLGLLGLSGRELLPGRVLKLWRDGERWVSEDFS